MSEISKTNAMRLLDLDNIKYQALEYSVSEEHLDGLHAADEIGLAYHQVYKTLVTYHERDFFVCLIPVDQHLSLKKLAKAAGVKKLEMLPVKNLQKVTGYVRGGCSPIGMKKEFPTFIEESVLLEDKIAISAGERGKQILITPEALINYCKLKIVDVIQ